MANLLRQFLVAANIESVKAPRESNIGK